MYHLNVDKKTGFKIVNPNKELIIRDENHCLFYTNETKMPYVYELNLPPGDYFIEKGTIRPMEKPVNYNLLPLPKHERNRPLPCNFIHQYGFNPAKCSVNWANKTITFDNALKNWPRVDRDFIRFHEYSHANYSTEKYCDLKACNYMLIVGYNPLQIGFSHLQSLSPRQYERKKFIVNQLCRHFGKKLM